jgi:hypothetical protein
VKTDTNCRFCGGTGTFIGMDLAVADSEVMLFTCSSCKGTGRRRDTLTPFLQELDDLQLGIDMQALFMEQVSNLGLKEMAAHYDREWERRERHEKVQWLREALRGSGYRSYVEQKRLYDRWVASGRQPAYAIPRDDYNGPHELGRAIDVSEPWHYQYPAKVTGRWPWYEHFPHPLRRWVWSIQDYLVAHREWREDAKYRTNRRFWKWWNNR